jgi:hypothetical protein
MKKIIIILMVMLISVIGVVYAECIDSDGENIYEVGTTSGIMNEQNITASDYCMSSVYLMELICDGDYVVSKQIECPEDYTCKNNNPTEGKEGKCVKEIVCDPSCADNFYCKEYPSGNQCEPLSDDACQETDGGINIYEHGVATGAFWGDADREVKGYFDYCVSSHGGSKDGILSESYCEDGLVKSKHIDCDFGCVGGGTSGKCLKEPEEEEDEEVIIPDREIEDEPKPKKDFEQEFMLLNQRDKNAIEDFKNSISLEDWHVLINHGRFRPYYALRDWLGDDIFEEKYSDETIDFKNFPHIFNYGNTFNAVVVVGSSATPKEKEVARYVYNSLEDFFSPSTNWPMDPLVTDISIEDDWVRNVITIGSPCNNEITAKVTHITSCDSDLEEGESALRLWDNDDFAQLAIVAHSDEDLMVAAEYFVEHLNNMNPKYRDEEFKGREIIRITIFSINSFKERNAVWS